MNTVQITGNLVKDPVIRATKTGKAVASFSVGVSKKITKANGDTLDLTDWINVTAWGTWRKLWEMNSQKEAMYL